MLRNNGFVYNSNRQTKSILCAYQNRINSLQVIKIENVRDFYWEKVLFPCQTILFNTVEQANLIIYSNNNARQC